MKWNEIIGDLCHDSARGGYTGPRITLVNEVILGMNHAPGAGSIVRPVFQQSIATIVPLLFHRLCFTFIRRTYFSVILPD